MDMYGNAYEVEAPPQKELWRFLSAFAENGRWKPISISSFAYLQKFEDKGERRAAELHGPLYRACL